MFIRAYSQYSAGSVYEKMYVYIFLFCLFDLLQSAKSNLAMPSRLRVKDCLYDGKSRQYSFPVTIGGIKEVVSCLKGCSCNGTAIAWQIKFNCEWCCCKMRVSHEEIVPGRIWFFLNLASRQSTLKKLSIRPWKEHKHFFTIISLQNVPRFTQ